MSMSVWECEHPGCKSQAVGCGGAIGLRAIGWYFQLGPVILCPNHRPDPMPCEDKYGLPEYRGEPCTHCTAEHEADKWQAVIAAGVAP